MCYMTHVRVKFKYAAEIEHNVNARMFLEYIGRLYGFGKEVRGGEAQCGTGETPQKLSRNDGNNYRNEEPVRHDEIRKRSEA